MGEAYYQTATGGPSVVSAASLVVRVVDHATNEVVAQVCFNRHALGQVRALTEQFHPRFEATILEAPAAEAAGWDGWVWPLSGPNGFDRLHGLLRQSAVLCIGELAAARHLSDTEWEKLRRAVEHRWYHGLTDEDLAAMRIPQGAPSSLADRLVRFLREHVGGLECLKRAEDLIPRVQVTP